MKGHTRPNHYMIKRFTTVHLQYVNFRVALI